MNKNLLSESTLNMGKKMSWRSKKENILGNDTLLQSKDTFFKFNKEAKITRIFVTFIFILIVFLTLTSRTFVLQMIQGQKNYSMSQNNSIRAYKIQAERGVIFDNNGKVLVRNKPAFAILMNVKNCSLEYTDFDRCMNSIDNISQFVKIDSDLREDIKSKIESRSETVTVATNVTKDALLIIEPRLRDYPGLYVTVSPIREYIFGESMSHLLGYTGISETDVGTVGKTGIEQYYNDSLTGIEGNKIVQVDSLGDEISVISEQSPLPGKDLYLYIDADLQKKAYELLKEKVEDEKSTAEAGAVVIQDPQTGGVRALVSYPGFDPNMLTQGISSKQLAELNSDTRFPFFNRAIAGAYPPGSVFKMITAAGVLSEKIVSATYQVFDPGYISVSGFTFRNWKLDGHGLVDMRRALQVSNDTYFYTVSGGYGEVKGLGIQKLHDWAIRLGLAAKTGIDLPGEVTGYMPDGQSREWYLGDTYITAIGQGDVLATPLQINNMVTYYANGGFLYIPQIVKENEGVEHTLKIIRDHLMSEQDYQVIRDGMHLAVTPGGTGYPVYDIPTKYGVELAGKTGTSEYIDKNGEDRTHAWFSVFGPYEQNDPSKATIAITVFLEGGGAGSDDAAPIARELLGLWFDKTIKNADINNDVMSDNSN